MEIIAGVLVGIGIGLIIAQAIYLEVIRRVDKK